MFAKEKRWREFLGNSEPFSLASFGQEKNWMYPYILISQIQWVSSWIMPSPKLTASSPMKKNDGYMVGRWNFLLGPWRAYFHVLLLLVSGRVIFVGILKNQRGHSICIGRLGFRMPKTSRIEFVLQRVRFCQSKTKSFANCWNSQKSSLRCLMIILSLLEFRPKNQSILSLNWSRFGQPPPPCNSGVREGSLHKIE